jgi:hypothetical protein
LVGGLLTFLLYRFIVKDQRIIAGIIGILSIISVLGTIPSIILTKIYYGWNALTTIGLKSC